MTGIERCKSQPKKKKKLNGLDKYVVFSISVMIIYTSVSLLIMVLTGYTYDTLTTCVFGFFGGEIVTCALIKIFKLTKIKTTKEEEDLYDG